MANVALPEFPKGKEFEELVSALLQTSGRYVERNILHRDVEEVLEVDIVLTNY